ncbi:HopJ type III effector protein [Flavobacterium ardleyense]|uniref:HopJ type III effector protein n=1 Tax=Flavobacterium ardleyense TaxID=2038737 RepID=A0ABW5Z8B9_9FLAO
MTVSILKEKVQNSEVLVFSEVIHSIESYYSFTPTSFTNGELSNEAGTNNGSCKVFSFAKEHNLDVSETLFMFGEHYQKVLQTPNEDDHQNIRNFIKSGWKGVRFSGNALELKK